MLPAFFTAQADRVLARWEARSTRKALADELLPSEDDQLLGVLVSPITLSLSISVGQIAADMVGGQPFTGRTDLRLQRLLSQSGQRVVGINDTTRRAIQDTILDGYQHGYSDFQIANGVADDGFRGLRDVVTETYHDRALAIARTEVGTASNLAAADRYSVAGVQLAELIDGPGCHLITHDDGPVANGLILPLAQASQYPLAHPNCRRIVIPVTSDLRLPVRVPLPAIAGAPA